MNSMTIGCISAVETSDSLLYNEEEFPYLYVESAHLSDDGRSRSQTKGPYQSHTDSSRGNITQFEYLDEMCFLFLMCSSIQKKKISCKRQRRLLILWWFGNENAFPGSEPIAEKIGKRKLKRAAQSNLRPSITGKWSSLEVSVLFRSNFPGAAVLEHFPLNCHLWRASGEASLLCDSAQQHALLLQCAYYHFKQHLVMHVNVSK